MPFLEKSLVASLAIVVVGAWFSASRPATAQGLMQRVATLEQEVANLQAENAILTTALADLEDALDARIAALESSPLSDLAGLVFVDNSNPAGPTVVFDSVNVQIIDGTGQTISSTPNGLGNLIIGYDEALGAPTVCSEGPYLNQVDCEDGGAIWASGQKTGNHNLVVGQRHNYTRSAGVVFGRRNTVNGESASVTGGMNNVSAGVVTTVHGGNDNSAAQNFSTVSGGFDNSIPFTSGNGAGVIGGGSFNTLLAGESTIGGGSGCVIPDGLDGDLGWGARTRTAGTLGDCTP